MHLLRYAWYACPTSGRLLYLAVFAGKRCLVQWQIKRPLPGCREEKLTAGIWQQMADTPPLLTAARMGRCTIPGTATEGSHFHGFQQALNRGRLLLQLIDSESGAVNTYSLIRMRTGGTAWLFGEVFYLPHASAATKPVPAVVLD